MWWFLSHSFPGLMALITGVNWLRLVYLGTGTLRNVSKLLLKHFCYREVPCPLLPSVDCLLSLLLVKGKCTFVWASELYAWINPLAFTLGVLFLYLLGFYMPPALLVAPPCLCFHFPFLLFLHPYGDSLHNHFLCHPQCLWYHWLLFPSTFIVEEQEHPKPIGYLLMRFRLKHHPNCMKRPKGSLGFKPPTPDFSTGTQVKLTAGNKLINFLVDTSTIFKAVGLIKINMSFEMSTLNIKLSLYQDLLNGK